MAMLQRIEQVDEPARSTAAYVHDPLPPLMLRELEELDAREQALPQRSSAQARKMIVSAIVGGVTLWGLLIGGVDLALKLIA